MTSLDTLPKIFVDCIREHGDGIAVRFKRDGQFTSRTWSEVFQDVRRYAVALVRSGAKPGDRIVLVSENRYEWIVSDMAIQLAQAIHVPVHAPLTAVQVGDQIHDSGAQIVLVSNQEQADKLAMVARSERNLHLYSFDSCDAIVDGKSVQRFDDVAVDVDDDEAERLVEAALVSVNPDSIVTILYTSGTTGEPKGVMLSQSNLVTNTFGMIEMLGQQEHDVRLTFLPMSHIFARSCDIYTWIATGAELVIAESRETVMQDCQATKPTLLNGVPYFFDRVRRSLEEQGRDDAATLRAALGGNIRLCCSGGAALPVHIFDFYASRGIPILQGYGLTETSPVISASSEESCKRGASGKPIRDVEVRIAGDGEILTRGPHIMVGYYRKPEATAEVIKDGWFYTGDLGYVDDEGFVYITGRKKEIIVTSGGKNVAPVQLETLLCEDPLILQAMVVGDDRPYLIALLVPDPETLRAEIVARGIAIHSPAEALVHPQVLDLFEQRVRERLKTVSYYEQVRKFTLINRGFTIETGEMTPKLSLRRRAIAENCRDKIEAMYGAEDVD